MVLLFDFYLLFAFQKKVLEKMSGSKLVDEQGLLYG